MTPEAWYIVLGSFLALIGGIITQIIMVRWGDKRAVATLKLLLVDAISQMNTIIDKLKEAYDKTNMVHIEYLLQLRSSRVVFDRNREFVVKFRNAELRKDIFEYFDKESLSDMVLISLENLRNKPELCFKVGTNIKNEVDNLLRIKELGSRIKDKLSRI